MENNTDVNDVKSYYIIVTLNKLCLNDSEFTVTVTFGKKLFNECDIFAKNETKIRPGESIQFFLPDDAPPLSDDADYCYEANLSANGNF